MSGTQGVLAARAPVAFGRPRLPRWRGHLHGSDLAWSIAFVMPYAALFAAFVIYPMGYGLWMGSDPALYAELLSDPRYLRAAVNTVLLVGLAVNVQMPGVAVRVLRAPPPLDQGAAGRLHPAVDLAGGPCLPVVPLDAGRLSAGLAQQSCYLHCSASRGRSGSIAAGSRSAATSSPISGNGCRCGR